MKQAIGVSFRMLHASSHHLPIQFESRGFELGHGGWNRLIKGL